MKSGSLGYLTKEGFRNLRVNKLMSFASIIVLFSCMFMMGFAYMVFENINSLVDNIEKENVILVYIEDDADPGEEAALQTQLNSLDNVDSVEYISKVDAYNEILDDMGDAGEYLKEIDENPLPNACKVTVKDMSLFAQTVKDIQKLDNVLRTRENNDLAKKLEVARRSITIISAVIVALLFIVSLFIISNTIRITMYSRRLEISIMKSVGATNRFIRWPFMIEGILLGVISGIISLGILWVLYEVATRYISNVSGLLTTGALVDFKAYALYIFAAFMLLGIFTGIFGSAGSIRKYLRERKFVELDEL